MDPFSTAPDFILDLIFLKLNEEDLHETLRVSKSWFWASIRRTKKLEITREYNPLKPIAEFYNNQRPLDEKMDCLELFKHLVLDELVVLYDDATTKYLVNSGCNTAKLTIEDFGEEEVSMTLASLQTITRLQSLEYCSEWGRIWHPFIVECLKSSDCEFDPNEQCPIETIKLNSSGWKTEDPVLHSVTKLSVWYVAIEFLRTLIDLCPNLEELRCVYGNITHDWQQVFPTNVKTIEMHLFNIDDNVARVVSASPDAGKHLLPYLCQNWESVEKFHFDGYIDVSGETVYEAFPQQREEVFECEFLDEEMNLASQLFQNREIHVKCYDRKALELNIPPTKSVKFELHDCDFKFSPGEVCVEPGKVEHLSLSLHYADGFAPEPFGPSSFEGFSRLTSLVLSRVNALAIKMALDQCPSIKKLKLENLKALTIFTMPRGWSFENVCDLILETREETISKVFQVFPRLSEFKYSHFFEVQQRRKEKADWLRQHLITTDKRFGVVFESEDEIRFMVSDDLQASLSQAQKLLNEFSIDDSMYYLKGFKLIPRVSNQKVIYVD